MRKNFSLGEKAIERLDALRDRVDAATDSEVIREALQLYEYFVKEIDAGTEFYVKRRNTKEPTKIQILL